MSELVDSLRWLAQHDKDHEGPPEDHVATGAADAIEKMRGALLNFKEWDENAHRAGFASFTTAQKQLLDEALEASE